MRYLYAAAGFVTGYAAFTAVSWLAVRRLLADHAHDTVQLTGWYAPKAALPSTLTRIYRDGSGRALREGWYKTW